MSAFGPPSLTLVPYVQFDRATGDIVAYGRTSQSAVWYQAERDGDVVEGEGHFDTHYVDLSGAEPVLAERAANPTVFLAGTLASLPDGAVVTITDASRYRETVVPAGSSLELEFEYPGTYVVEVTAPRVKKAVFDVTKA